MLTPSPSGIRRPSPWYSHPAPALLFLKSSLSGRISNPAHAHPRRSRCQCGLILADVRDVHEHTKAAGLLGHRLVCALVTENDHAKAKFVLDAARFCIQYLTPGHRDNANQTRVRHELKLGILSCLISNKIDCLFYSENNVT